MDGHQQQTQRRRSTRLPRTAIRSRWTTTWPPAPSRHRSASSTVTCRWTARSPSSCRTDCAPDCPNSPCVSRRSAARAAGRLGPPRRLPEDGLGRGRRPDVDPDRSHPEDLDVAELYDGFTFLTIAWLEALGVCGDGRRRAVRRGRVTHRPRRRAAAKHLRRAAFRGPHARLLGAPRGVPATARPGL